MILTFVKGEGNTSSELSRYLDPVSSVHCTFISSPSFSVMVFLGKWLFNSARDASGLVSVHRHPAFWHQGHVDHGSWFC